MPFVKIVFDMTFFVNTVGRICDAVYTIVAHIMDDIRQRFKTYISHFTENHLWGKLKLCICYCNIHSRTNSHRKTRDDDFCSTSLLKPLYVLINI